LANALAEQSESEVSVIYFRELLPKSLFPGREHVGKPLTTLNLTNKIASFDGMDYNSPFTWIKAYRFLSNFKPDFLILQWWTSSIAHMHFILSLFKKMLGFKLIVEFHEVVDPLEEAILPVRLYSRLMGRIIAKSGDAFITHSKADKLAISEKYKLNLEKIYVIPHGLYNHYIPIDKFEARKKLDIAEENVLLFFGLIRTYKGVEYLIEAFETLSEELVSKTRLLIVGELWEGSDIVLKRIQSSKYRDKISLIAEYIPDDKVSLYFSAADVLILPYIRASQSGVAHIAMSLGKPVVVSEVGGLKEALAAYKGAFFVPPKNIGALKDGILNALKNKNIEFPRPNYNWSEIASRYKEVLNMLKQKTLET
jgi:glycosyltransferase involved in cell wall biosynthesis